ncbi:uncharacterized protein [Diadema antillarum]|uniref:uncharacterized protein n=1 Tax=Diadema antillarum TaxID=105358 RepID=UPI003A89DEED
MTLLQGILGRRLRLRHVAIFSLTLGNFILCSQACDCSFQPEVCDGSYIFEGTITAQYGNPLGFADITYSVEVTSITRDYGYSLKPGVMVNISTGTHTCGFPDLEVNWMVLFSTLDRDGPNNYSIDRCGSVVQTADDEAYMYLPPDRDLTCSSDPMMPMASGTATTATPLLLLVCGTVAMWFHSKSYN